VGRDDAGNAGLVSSVRKRFAGGGRVAEGVRYGTSVNDFTATLDRVHAEVRADPARFERALAGVADGTQASREGSR
jgi:hypothetical protein